MTVQPNTTIPYVVIRYGPEPALYWTFGQSSLDRASADATSQPDVSFSYICHQDILKYQVLGLQNLLHTVGGLYLRIITIFNPAAYTISLLYVIDMRP